MGYSSELFKLPRYFDDANTNYHYCCLMKAYRTWLAGHNWMSDTFANFEDTYAFKEFNCWDEIEKYAGPVDHMKWIEEESLKFGAGTDMFESIMLADGCSDSEVVEACFVYSFNKLAGQFGEINEENIRSIYNNLKDKAETHRLDPVVVNRGFVYSPDPDMPDYYIKTSRHIDGVEAVFEGENTYTDIDCTESDWDSALYSSKHYMSHTERWALECYTNAIVDIAMENNFVDWTYYFSCGR